MSLNLIENKYDSIIFDFDGTISKIKVDWVGVREALHNHFLNEHNTNIDFTSYSGGLSEVDSLFGEKGNEEANAICYQYESASIRESKHNFKCINLVKNFRGIKVIWSSNQSKVIKDILLSLDILDQFKVIVGKDDVRKAKPHYEGYYIIQKHVEINPKKTLFIGDSPSDQQAAEKLSIDYIDVSEI